MDQGSDGWCPAMWLLYAQELRMVLFFDASHRLWNDLRTAIAKTDMWSTVLLWGVVFNTNYGPYEGASWWRQAQEAAADYSQT
eukprot:4026356-Lingulodinium_polyedra.AAC.1